MFDMAGLFGGLVILSLIGFVSNSALQICRAPAAGLSQDGVSAALTLADAGGFPDVASRKNAPA